MPIAKQAHDGKIWAESNVTGKGETFILNLPFVVLSTPNEQIANSRPPLDSLTLLVSQSCAVKFHFVPVD
jgi:hypothetical protein